MTESTNHILRDVQSTCPVQMSSGYKHLCQKRQTRLYTSISAVLSVSALLNSDYSKIIDYLSILAALTVEAAVLIFIFALILIHIIFSVVTADTKVCATCLELTYACV